MLVLLAYARYTTISMRYLITYWSFIFIIISLFAAAFFAVVWSQRGLANKKSLWYGRTHLAGFLSAAAVLCSILLLYMISETQQLIVKEVSYKLGLKNEIHIALISDTQTTLHKQSGYMNKIVDHALEQNPDAVLIAGDLINNELPLDDELPHLEPLRRLAQNVPTYAVLGNHEYGISNPVMPAVHPNVSQTVYDHVKSLGVHMLVNDLMIIEKNGKPVLELYGFDDLWNPVFVEPKLPPKTLSRIVLSHNPDAIYLIDKDTADVVVSGHTHGGQIRFPWFGASTDVATILPKKFYKGASVQNGIPLFITSGLGESGPPVRLFNLPEIVMLTIN